jgi:uncharacterized sporulation protein YeaH/YhbH (DUF444 family)
VFALSKEEFMQVFFEDLALPHLLRTHWPKCPNGRASARAFSSDGHAEQPARGAQHARRDRPRIATVPASRREIRELQEQLAALHAAFVPGDELAAREIKALEEQIGKLRARVERIPYLDPIDLRFRSRIRVPVPTSKAVMFCLMDVSGSMDEARKELSKRFFILLYLF